MTRRLHERCLIVRACVAGAVMLHAWGRHPYQPTARAFMHSHVHECAHMCIAALVCALLVSSCHISTLGARL